MNNDATPSGFEIAIIGTTGRFPGAETVDAFWKNLRDGVESINRFTPEELLARGRNPQDVSAPNFIPSHGALDGFDLFDAEFFGYRSTEAEVMDPQHRLFLEAAWEALETAGYNPKTYPGLIGIFGGSSANHYLHTQVYGNPAALARVGDFQASYSNQMDFLTTRVSYKLNLGGPSVVVQSACSTSLVAVHMACQQLLSGACDIALAGGVSISLPRHWGYFYEEGMIFSPDGHCRAFDADAQGTLKGDGVGMVVLKRLADALADNDSIDAVILGSAVNNDGSDKVGYTAPGLNGQASVIDTAQALAGIEADEIGYIEAHGTGTPLGDPIEVAALNQVFRHSSQRNQFCGLGSVKTNIGHLDAAAGVAGLIKAVLAIKHQTIPPSLYFQRPNPKLNLESSPFFVAQTAKQWMTNGAPRRAGVSSFGIGGTNAHVVLEQAPAQAPSDTARPHQLLLCSSRCETSLRQATQRLANHLDTHPQQALADVAYTLQVGREHHPYRFATVATDHATAVSTLNAASEFKQTANGPPYLVFMFPGQGAQYVNMARGLYETEPAFRDRIDDCAQRLLPHVGCDIRTLLYPTDADPEISADRLKQTAIAQPVLFTIEYALAHWWMSLGIQPEAMVGHSLGEYVAACLAGVFSLDDALALIALRGRLMQAQAAGEMLAVPLDSDALAPYLDADLDLAAINTPTQCVVSGPPTAIAALEKRIAAEHDLECRRLHTSHAFHSAMMEPVLTPFLEALSAVTLHAPRRPFVSTVTGTWITPEQAQDPQYWARNIRDTVRFAEAIGELIKQPRALLLEVGPGTTLGGLARRHPERTPSLQAVSSLRHPSEKVDDQVYWLSTLGQLWTNGQNVDWDALHGGAKHRRVPLPTYPFQRRRYWIDPIDQPKQVSSSRRITDLADFFYIPSWRRSALPRSTAAKERWLIIGDAGERTTAFANTLLTQGAEVLLAFPQKAPAPAETESYTVDWTDQHQLANLYERLRSQQRIPQHIVHLGDLDRPASQDVFYSVLSLAQSLLTQDTAPSLTVVAHRSYAVLGDEAIDPERVLPQAVTQILPVEQSQCRTRFIDIDVNAPTWTQQVLAEAIAQTSDHLVAYRGDQRWLPSIEPVHLPAPKTNVASRLRPHGVYLISGGLGGMGLELATYLARTVQARLILLGRTALPERAAWPDWLSQHDEDDATSRRLRRIEQIEALGGEVLVLTADVADEKDMVHVRETAESRFGAIHGIIHAAGVPPRDDLIETQTREHIASVLAAKVQGTLVLSRTFDRATLDFMVLCSSLSSVVPLPGRVEYTAANLFLDAFAQSQRTPGVISVNWDGWAETGMAFDATGGKLASGLRSAEGVEAWARLLEQPWPQVMVCGQDLAALMRADSQSPPVDATELPPSQHEQAASVGDTSYVAPRDHSEKTLVEIWQELLGAPRIGIHDNFFELGGDSVVSIQVVSRARRAGLQISIKEMFEHQTIAELAQVSAPSSKEPQVTDGQVIEKNAAAPASTNSTSHTAKPDISPADARDIIPKAPRNGRLPLSFAQERIWFLEQLEPGAAIHNKLAILKITGELDIQALRRAFASLVERHEILRTAYPVMDGEPIQAVGEPFAPDVSLIEVQKDFENTDEWLSQYSKARVREHFNLAKEAPWRAQLLRLSSQQHWLFLTLHHITTDAWSMEILLRELGLLYQAEHDGHPVKLAPLPLQFADFAAWQRDWLVGDVLEQQLGYWRSQLAGLTVLDLPTDHPRPAIQSFDGARHALEHSKSFTEALRSLSRAHGVTPFIAALTLFKILLHRYSGQSDIVVGTPVADRAHVETDGILGPFVNNLVLRTDLSGNPSVAQILDRVRSTSLAANEHRELPFERLVEALHPERDRSRSPLFQVMLIYLNVPSTVTQWDSLTIETMERHSDTSEFDLTLCFSDPGPDGSLTGWIEYNTGLFDETTIARMADHFLNLTLAAAHNPQLAIADLPLLTASEQAAFQAWNATRRDFPHDMGIHQLFETQARLNPTAIAAECSDGSLSYEELDKRSNQLARCLVDQGVRPETYVALCLDRTSDLLIALLGVLKAGGAYVPLDPSYPMDRLSYMLEDSGAIVVLTQTALKSRLPAHNGILCLDEEQVRLARYDASPLDIPFNSSQQAYVIYTSGSTGKPKGVQVEHRSVVNFLNAMRHQPGMAASDALLAVTTISFDIHVLELFLPLYVGARIILADRDTATDPRRLLDKMKESKASVMQATPATWRMLLDAGWDKSLPIKVLCGGEALSSDLAQRILSNCTELWNLYGPTEATVWATVEKIDSAQHISVGHPIDNIRTYVVDAYGHPQPIGIPGELWLAGTGVARGYLRRPDLTAERFVADPVIQDERAYRTGDLARTLTDGRIEILGRLDHQVKLRGHRLELGEIEAMLSEHPAVRQAVVIMREDKAGDQRLVAYLLGTGADRPDSSVLRSFVGTRLPDYMIPSIVVWLDSYPLTPNNKVDRRALPAPEPAVVTQTKPSDETLNASEQLIADLFAEVLGIEGVGRYDNFFDLGGHSLLSMKVVDRFEKATGLRMHPGELFQQTVGQIAAHYQGRLPQEAHKESNPERIQPFFFRTGEHTLYGCHHVPLGQTRDVAVLICTPSGHEYTRSHRALRQLAAQLAKVGYHAVRFDYFGTGDSAGEYAEASLTQWRSDINDAIAECQRRSGISRVVVIGMRLGASLALQACQDRDDVSALVLWSPIWDGTALLEEWRAMQHTHDSALGGEPAAADEILGLPLTSIMVDDLTQLSMPQSPQPRLLICHQEDGMTPTELKTRWLTAGIRFTEQSTQGPEVWKQEALDGIVPMNTLKTIVSWLGEHAA